ncbi:ribosomal-protein-alanine N-acetyltransferase [Kineococcus xinjiangensis]|uniref:[Ribosomal protein bS18]-alanine N-acetyltransferase n=1 Tax=Kineococcus xinjiangensis TaxID=512762 RepID=A0A2S6ITL1_9ACTN|nr:ribosomal protein S18-alanine N-acetyltransferase [Kineococcus xinjiangensis]PPK97583.1 ribosomal-protein-alanine N-acetyltransferase [Kineococcus xinjiangensis]
MSAAPPGVELRPLRWWDLDAVLGAERELFGPTAWSAESFWAELAQPNRRYLAAVRGEDLLGYGGVMVNGADADVQTLAVAPAGQRQGVGAALLQALAGIAADLGATVLLLEVAAGNAAALRLYERSGFERIALRRRYYPDGGDAVIMRRRL